MVRPGLYENESWDKLRLDISYHPNEEITGKIEVPALTPLELKYADIPQTVIPVGNYNRAEFTVADGITLMAGSKFTECTFTLKNRIYISSTEEWTTAPAIVLDKCKIELSNGQDADPAIDALFMSIANSIGCSVKLNNCQINIPKKTKLLDLTDFDFPSNAQDKVLPSFTFSKCTLINEPEASLVTVASPAIVSFSDMEFQTKPWEYKAESWTPMITIDKDLSVENRGAQIYFANIKWIPEKAEEGKESGLTYWVKSSVGNVNSDVLNTSKTSALTIRCNGLYLPRKHIRFEFNFDDTMWHQDISEAIESVGTPCLVNLEHKNGLATTEGSSDLAILPALKLTNCQVTVKGKVGIDTGLILEKTGLVIDGSLEVAGYILMDDLSSLEVKETVKTNGEDYKAGEKDEESQPKAPDENYKVYIEGPYDSRIPYGSDLEDAKPEPTGDGNPFNNKVLSKMFEKFGDRIAAIVFDNGSSIMIGYANHASCVPHVRDIQLVTIEGIDYVVIPGQNPNPKDRRMGIGWKTYHPTMCLQQVYVMNEGISEKFRPDPFVFG